MDGLQKEINGSLIEAQASEVDTRGTPWSTRLTAFRKRKKKSNTWYLPDTKAANALHFVLHSNSDGAAQS